MARHGLDELMIVNPGSPASTEALTLRGSGAVCRVRKVEADAGSRSAERLFLGADGIVYRIDHAPRGRPCRYFFGADGTLFETDR